LKGERKDLQKQKEVNQQLYRKSVIQVCDLESKSRALDLDLKHAAGEEADLKS